MDKKKIKKENKNIDHLKFAYKISIRMLEVTWNRLLRLQFNDFPSVPLKKFILKTVTEFSPCIIGLTLSGHDDQKCTTGFRKILNGEKVAKMKNAFTIMLR